MQTWYILTVLCQLAALLAEHGAAPALPLDVRDDASLAVLVATLAERGVTVAHLVNNAGVAAAAGAGSALQARDSLDRATLLEVLDTNLASVAALTEACGVLTGTGKVLNIRQTQ